MVSVFGHVRSEPLQSRSRLSKWLGDFKLLGWLGVAYLIVWRALRREQKRSNRRIEVQDLIYIGLTVLFFLIALAYVRGCEKLH